MAKVDPASKPANDKHAVATVKGPKPSLKKLLQLLRHDRILENEFIEGLPEMITAVGDLSGIKNGEWPAIDKFEDPQLLARLLNAGLNPISQTKRKSHPLPMCAAS